MIRPGGGEVKAKKRLDKTAPLIIIIINKELLLILERP
jgi:hypothetical protein